MKRALEGIRILVIEDDTDNRELLEFMLSEEGAVLMLAGGGAQARTLLETAIPDVILSDLSLAGEDGCAVLEAIRANAGTRRIPAVALTAHAEDSALVRATKSGFDRYITKPADVSEIVAAVAGLAAGASEPDSSRSGRVSLLPARIATHVATADLPGLVALLNASAPYRFTSICRFDGGQFTTLASFDREGHLASVPPEHPAAAAPYCALVQSERAPVSVEDATRDGRVSSHPLRALVLSYCGVPVLRPDGTIFGSLFHSDPRAIPTDERHVTTLERAARMLCPELSSFEKRRNP